MFTWREIKSPSGGSTGCFRWYFGFESLCDHEHDESNMSCEDAREAKAHIRSLHRLD